MCVCFEGEEDLITFYDSYFNFFPASLKVFPA